MRRQILGILAVSWLALSPAAVAGEESAHERAVRLVRMHGGIVDEHRDASGNLVVGVRLCGKSWVGSMADLSHLAQLTGLRSLDVNGLAITDEDLVNFQFLASLELLRLRSTKITDVGLVYLKQLENLRGLDVRNAPITVEGLKHLKDLPNLRTMWISGTKINRRTDRTKMREYCPQVSGW